MRTSSTDNTMSLVRAQLTLIVFAILASLTVASPLDLNQKVTDGYFTMCMRPDFSTWYQGPDWKCEHRVPWISGQCSKPHDQPYSPQTQLTYPRKNRPDSQIAQRLRHVGAARRGLRRYVPHVQVTEPFASVFGNRIVIDLFSQAMETAPAKLRRISKALASATLVPWDTTATP